MWCSTSLAPLEPLKGGSDVSIELQDCFVMIWRRRSRVENMISWRREREGVAVYLLEVKGDVARCRADHARGHGDGQPRVEALAPLAMDEL
jgi:hypothetical protein